MAQSGIKSKSKLKTKLVSINTELGNLEKALKNLQDNLNKMMTGGEGKTPLWNGNLANEYYKEAKKNQDNNIVDYTSAYKMLDNLAVKYEHAVKQDKS